MASGRLTLNQQLHRAEMLVELKKILPTCEFCKSITNCGYCSALTLINSEKLGKIHNLLVLINTMGITIPAPVGVLEGLKMKSRRKHLALS